MVVTGDKWVELSLGKLIPALDPDDPASAASRLVSKINDLSNQVKDGVGKVESIVDKVAQTIGTVNQLNTEIKSLQNEIDNLIGNASNTGIYAHALGINPVFSVTQPTEIVNELRRYYFVDTADLNRPVFEGTTAFVGGMLLLFLAPNPEAVIKMIKRLGVVFSIFEAAAETLSSPDENQPDFIGTITNPFGQFSDDINDCVNFAKQREQYSLVKLPDDKVFDRTIYKQDPDETNYNTWFALRLGELIPQLDPLRAGSAAATIMDAERSLVNGMTGATDELLAYSRGLTPFTNALNDINTQLAKLSTNVIDLVQSIGRTGLYSHLLGMDGSLHNNQEFVDAAGRAMIDITDPNRPTPEGEMTFYIGLVMMFGAPNPLGLKSKFKNIGMVMKGFSIF